MIDSGQTDGERIHACPNRGKHATRNLTDHACRDRSVCDGGCWFGGTYANRLNNGGHSPPYTEAKLATWIMALVILSLAFSKPVQAEESGAKPPRLFVLLVFDQMRGDFPSRWASLFGEGGFKRLCEEGTWFQDAHYPYSMTMTAAGHASLSTGMTPSRHGIVGNDWIDHGLKVYSVESERWQRRIWRTDPTPIPEGRACSPERLMVPTFGDMLKEKLSDQARVVSLSIKDRSAVLMGGHKADACYWFDPKEGLAATSSYYGDRVHPWIKRFNDERSIMQWFGKEWARLRDDIDYEQFSGPDNVLGEGDGIGQGRTFPHPFSKNSKKPDANYFESVAVSPMAGELLVDLALQAVEEERLGADETPDLLCVSFSSNDLIGHNWGPDSQEVLDVTLRSDRQIARFLSKLDELVGRGEYVVGLSADHGVCALPEVLKGKGIDAGRIFSDELMKASNEYLDGALAADQPPTAWLSAGANYWVSFNPSILKQHGVEIERAGRLLAAWLEKNPAIAFARTRQQLGEADEKNARLIEMIAKSTYPDRVGDVVVIPKQHYFFASALTGTSHGTPYEYDTHVPVILYGKGIMARKRSERVPPQTIAAVFYRLAGIALPTTLEATVPRGVVSGEP